MVAVVFSHALVLSLLAASDAGAPVALPEVNVPAPANDLPATAPLRRDATASLTTIDAAERRTATTVPALTVHLAGPVAGPASHCSSTTTTSWTPRWPAPTG